MYLKVARGFGIKLNFELDQSVSNTSQVWASQGIHPPRISRSQKRSLFKTKVFKT